MDEFENDGETVLGSLLLEPLVMGAGGMVFVDPLFQRVLVQVRDRHIAVKRASLLSAIAVQAEIVVVLPLP